MKRSSVALAILALAILACKTPGLELPTQLPTEKPELPMQNQAALAIPAPTIEKLPTRENALAIVTAAESLHIRSSASEKAAVSGYLAHGDTVTLTGVCKSGWAQILWKDSTAWVSARYLSDNKCKE